MRELIATYLDVVPADQRGGVSVWGVVDGDSWLIDLYNRLKRQLLFFSNFLAKPALQGFADAL